MFNFDTLINEVQESTKVSLAIENFSSELEGYLPSRTGKTRKILPLFNFGEAGLLFGILRSLSQLDSKSMRIIEQKFNLQTGTLTFLKINFGRTLFFSNERRINPLPMNLEKVKMVAEYIMYTAKEVDITELISSVTEEVVQEYYEFCENKAEEENSLLQNSPIQTNVDNCPFSMD